MRAGLIALAALALFARPVAQDCFIYEAPPPLPIDRQAAAISSLINEYHPEIPEAEREAIIAAVKKSAAKAGIDPLLVAAVIAAESEFKHRQPDGRITTSRCGARGLMQLHPAFHRASEDPAENIDEGTAYLAVLLRQFKRVDLALAAYNAGPNVAEKALTGYSETRLYVPKVLGIYERLRTEGVQVIKRGGLDQ